MSKVLLGFLPLFHEQKKFEKLLLKLAKLKLISVKPTPIANGKVAPRSAGIRTYGIFWNCGCRRKPSRNELFLGCRSSLAKGMKLF
jgi:hypothetical protein